MNGEISGRFHTCMVIAALSSICQRTLRLASSFARAVVRFSIHRSCSITALASWLRKPEARRHAVRFASHVACSARACLRWAAEKLPSSQRLARAAFVARLALAL